MSLFYSQTQSCSFYYHVREAETSEYFWYFCLFSPQTHHSVLSKSQWQHEVKVNKGEKQTLIKFSPGGENLHMLSAMTVDQKCDVVSLNAH